MSNKHDDYLVYSKYQGHQRSPDFEEFSVFEEGGDFYFAMHDENGMVALRSEGYSSEKARENGMESVRKNRDIEERWSVVEMMKKWFLSLKAGNHQEIAKGGAFDTKAEAEAYLAFLLGKSVGTAAPVQGKILSETRNVVNTTRNVINETRKPLGETRNLIGENRRVISETRNLIGENRKVTKYAAAGAVTALGAMSFAEIDHVKSSGPAAIKEEVSEKIGGWWPLLLFLLFPLLYFMFPPVTAAPIAPIPWNSVPIVKPVVVKKCNCDALTHPVFALPDGEPPKITDRLGRAPEYGNSHDLSPAEFYTKLKRKYDSSQTEKNFLNGIFKQMGYTNGFEDATASLFSHEVIPRGINANLGGTPKHKTYYRKMMTNEKDRQAFRIKAANYCDMFFMKTCGNHMFYHENCSDIETE